MWSSGAAAIYQVPNDALGSHDTIRLANLVGVASAPRGSLDIRPGRPHELMLQCTGGGPTDPVAVTAFVDGKTVLSGEATGQVGTGGPSVGFFHSDFGRLPPGEPPISVSFDRIRFRDLAQDPTADFGGPTIVDDSFIDDSLRWSEGNLSDPIRNIEVNDGALVLTVGPEGGGAVVTPVDTPTTDIIGDQRVEAQVVLEPTASFYLVCRAGDDFREVRFGVNSDRSLHLVRVPRGDEGLDSSFVELNDIVGAGPAELSGERVELALECVDGDGDDPMTAIGYLDGEEVIRGTDPNPNPDGFAAVAVGNLGRAPGADHQGYQVKVLEFRLIDLSA